MACNPDCNQGRTCDCGAARRSTPVISSCIVLLLLLGLCCVAAGAETTPAAAATEAVSTEAAATEAAATEAVSTEAAPAKASPGDATSVATTSAATAPAEAALDQIAAAATSPTTFAVCKSADVVSTLYVIQNGIGYESNPLMAAVLAHGALPFIGLSYCVYWWIKQLGQPTATLIANAITCPVALHNLLLIP